MQDPGDNSSDYSFSLICDDGHSIPSRVPDQLLDLSDANINDLSLSPSDDESVYSSPSFSDADHSDILDNLARSIQDMSILDEGVVDNHILLSPRVTTRSGRVVQPPSYLQEYNLSSP